MIWPIILLMELWIFVNSSFDVSFLCSYSANVPTDDKNWPPFFPIIHHDIANEIPVNAQRLQYLAFASWLGMVLNCFVCIVLLKASFSWMLTQLIIYAFCKLWMWHTMLLSIKKYKVAVYILSTYIAFSRNVVPLCLYFLDNSRLELSQRVLALDACRAVGLLISFLEHVKQNRNYVLCLAEVLDMMFK